MRLSGTQYLQMIEAHLGPGSALRFGRDDRAVDLPLNPTLPKPMYTLAYLLLT